MDNSAAVLDWDEAVILHEALVFVAAYPSSRLLTLHLRASMHAGNLERSMNNFAMVPAALRGDAQSVATARRRIVRRAWRKLSWQAAVEQEELSDLAASGDDAIYVGRCSELASSAKAWRLYLPDGTMADGFRQYLNGNDAEFKRMGFFDECISFILSGMKYLWFTVATLDGGPSSVGIVLLASYMVPMSRQSGVSQPRLIQLRQAEIYAEQLKSYVAWLPEIRALGDRLRSTSPCFGLWANIRSWCMPILIAARRSCGVDWDPDRLNDQYQGDFVAFLLDEEVIECRGDRFVLGSRGSRVLSDEEEELLWPFPDEEDKA